jgi:O-antigen ligase
LLLWIGINTGPENLDLEVTLGSWSGLFNGVRAAFPLVVLAAWFLHIFLRRKHQIRSFTWPEALWFYYGAVCLIASAYAEPWFRYAYWGFAYLSAFGAVEIYMGQSSTPERAADLNRLSWVFGSVVLIIVLWVARGQLVQQSSTGLSGYGVISRMPTVGGMAMVRPSGISRLAAIPAIVVFVWFWNTQGVFRIASLAIFVPTAYLVWIMQSRGSLFSFAFALSFVMVFAEGKQRRLGSMIALVFIAVYVVGFVPANTIHHLLLYATRGEQGQELASMSGRNLIFHEAWQHIQEAPFIGYGPQADRRVLAMVGNAQNAVLYALLCGGFLGAAGFVGGLVVSWVFLIGALRRRHLMTRVERTTLLQVAGVLAFLTMRSYPENCAALFSVDLLVQLPAMVYLGELDRRMRVPASAARTVYLHHVPTAPALPPAVNVAN